jgi:ubiquinone biosynthesis protein
MSAAFGIFTMTGLIVALALIFPIALAFLARRMLGNSIGWPRSLLMAVGIEMSGFSLAEVTLRHAGAADEGAEVSSGVIFLLIELSLAWAFALGVAGLVLLELIAPTGSVPAPATAIRRIGCSMRQCRRIVVIAFIASRHKLIRFTHRSRRKGSAEGRTPEALAAALEDCGPTFVKLGQMLSTRKDIIPDEYARALSRLQNQVRAADWSTIRTEIESQLGGSLDDSFLHVDETPLAAASIAQVHAAILLDGTSAVIKVQRPDARARVLQDIELIRRIGSTIESRTEWGKSMGVTALVDGFTDSLELELDFTAELRHSELIRKTSVGEGSAITIAAIYPELSTGTVLTMERANGVPIGSASDLIAGFTQEEASALAGRIFEEILRQILAKGIFHADLHPGNILLSDTGEVTLIDFGSVGILEREGRLALTRLLTAVDTDDAVAVVEALSMVCTIPNEADLHLLESEVGRVLTVVRSRGNGGSELFPELFGLVRRHRIRVPTSLAAALRSIATLEGSLVLIDPELDIVAAARDIAPRIYGELTPVRSVARSLAATVAMLTATGARLPRRIESITAGLESGAFARGFHPFARSADRMFVQGLVGQLTRAAIAVALIFASVALIVTDTGPLLTPTMRVTTYVGLSLGVIAFVLAMRILVRRFRR